MKYISDLVSRPARPIIMSFFFVAALLCAALSSGRNAFVLVALATIVVEFVYALIVMARKRSKLIILLPIELLLCFFYWVWLALDETRDGTPELVLQVWTASAVMRVLIALSKFSSTSRKALVVVSAAMLVTSTIQGVFSLFPNFHQVLFITGTTSLIFMFGAALPLEVWRGWLRRAAIVLSFPFAILAWSMANIAFVSAAARMAANGDASCILIQDSNSLFSYRQSNSIFDLQGFKLYVPFTNAGGSDNFQWTFHALLITKDRQLANWSFQSQRFEPLTENNIRNLHLQRVACSSVGGGDTAAMLTRRILRPFAIPEAKR